MLRLHRAQDVEAEDIDHQDHDGDKAYGVKGEDDFLWWWAAQNDFGSDHDQTATISNGNRD